MERAASARDTGRVASPDFEFVIEESARVADSVKAPCPAMVDSRRVTVARALPGDLELAGEQLDVGPADREQAQLTAAAPGGELEQVQPVGVAGQVAVVGQEPR